MQTRLRSPSGFAPTAILAVIAVLVIIGGVGAYAYHKQHKTNSSTVSSTTNGSQAASRNATSPSASTDPYAGWQTYADTGYASASGISIKYPSNWEITIPGRSPVGNTSSPAAKLTFRSVDLAATETPQQEWTTCATAVSADACGPSPGDQTISGSSTTISGLAAYTATMKNSFGTYYVTVIKGTNPIGTAGTPFVEFTVYSTDPAIIGTYRQIMASAAFHG